MSNTALATLKSHLQCAHMMTSPGFFELKDKAILSLLRAHLLASVHDPPAFSGLSSLTAIDADFFPDEVLAWADMHLTRLTLSTSDSQTMRGMAGLVPQLSSLDVSNVHGGHRHKVMGVKVCLRVEQWALLG
eukprot:1158759-Pelagomonas_calceolata.AAC.4